MKRPLSDNVDTLTSMVEPEGSPSSDRVCLTVLTHPEPELIGARAFLPEIQVGRVASLSRLTPEFTAPVSGVVRPLADLYASRQPTLLSWRDGVVLTPQVSGSRVVVAGHALTESRRIPTAELRPGVVIELSGQTSLLLHLRSQPESVMPLGLVGHSEQMDSVRWRAMRAAMADVPVLLTGETGVGKELIARALHQAGPRRDGPWIAFNVAEIQPETAASVLFGHVRGAFTGANHDHEGLFARAHGGTLFLDEIGDMAPDVQAMLLRVLETGELQRLGDRQARKVDVHVVAATDQLTDGPGALRSQLLYRLAGFHLHVPPLRDRPEDLGPLVAHFLAQEVRRTGSPPETWLPAPLMHRLVNHRWPGNVRELRNLLRTLLIHAGGREKLGQGVDLNEILGEPSALPPRLSGEEPRTGPLTDEDLAAALLRNHWSMAATARDLNIARSTLYVAIDRSTTLRKAADIPETELRAAADATGNQVDEMAALLQASPRGIRLIMRSLGLPATGLPPDA